MFKATEFFRLQGCRAGNIAIAAAVGAPLVLYSLSLGVDYGMLTLQQRRLQQDADLAAMVAASDAKNAEANLRVNFQQNGLNFIIQTDTSGVSKANLVQLAVAEANKFDGIATITPGTYVADPATDVAKRFVAGAQPYDAVKVAIQQMGRVYFASPISTAPTLAAVGTASTQKIAAFSIGSRLASLNGGVLNGLLGSLLGTTISLKAMDYDALVSADVNLLSVIDTLATDLNLTALTYSDVLDTQISFSQFMNSVAKSANLSGTAKAALKTLQNAANTTKVKFTIGDILDLGPLEQRPIGSGSHLSIDASAMSLINASARAANLNKQVAVDLGATVPGIANVTLMLAIGEPPQETPATVVGGVGAKIRTAQTRVQLKLTVSGLAAVAGLSLQVPLYVEVAYAEGNLANITCLGGGPQNANVAVDAIPGIADIELGEADPASFAYFTSKPRVKAATLIDSGLAKVTALSSVNITNMTKSTLSFSAADIAAATIKNVSTKDTLTSTVTSLLTNAKIDVQLLGFIKLGTNDAVEAAVAKTLSGLTAPLDDLLYNTLLLLGVKVGEADVRVTDARCQQPVLVQ
ncbi:TadG family pilus assembly protein [Rhizobium sp. RAF56]|jgi:uncharacterized membrane protein|uniref:TadG family pilus assembly protein n=1 Tax=Rhizobium sp. RAF56 TaxID=3233062 RepID=UPI003F9D3FD6